MCNEACKSLFLSVLGAEVEGESEEIYPTKICSSCYLKLHKSKSDPGIVQSILSTWSPHSSSCQLCSDHEIMPGPGRPKKPKLDGRPKHNLKKETEKKIKRNQYTYIC